MFIPNHLNISWFLIIQSLIYKVAAVLLHMYFPLQRGEVPLLSASVSDNSGNSPQMAAPRRSCEIDQSMQRFHVGCDNRCLLGNEMAN